ncbi:NAD+ synthase [Ahrensia marina]|uniref:NAD+ synthase n=1 Tax=Ahrensia marina TaxID=1514904 RepID=UPI0035D0F564
MSKDTLNIAVAQLNPVMGDLAANILMARDARMEAKRQGADLIAFSELFISGYPPEDLIDKDAFLHACREACEELARETDDGGPAVLMGTPWLTDDGKRYNAVVMMDGGEVTAVRAKVDLPNYSVFDEKRVFDAGPLPGPIDFRGVRLGVPVCEDAWSEEVPECLAETGAELLIVPNGSPWWEGKTDERVHIMVQRVVETDLPLLYINQLGGQDELVFDGGSFALAKDRTLALQMPQFEAAVQMINAKRINEGWTFERGQIAALPDDLEADWRACVMGLGDYVNKNGFPGVVLGLSGGIDSAICAAMAVDALGAHRVHCVMMPYEYTAQHSLEDAEACAKALGVRYDVVEIHAPVEGFLSALGPLFEGTKEGVTEENLQSRTRGTILMALSNKFGSMVVTTGNKSEMSVGYATLYGDMNGGFNPIKDVYKTDVYRMAAWRNAHQPCGLMGPGGEVIPERIITKAPSAELRPDQTDQDSLPEYDVLDGILRGLVEDEKSLQGIVADGYDLETVGRIEHLLYIAEYKRRQAAPGVKLTSRAFGRDRRYPITNRFRDRRDPAHPQGTTS